MINREGKKFTNQKWISFFLSFFVGINLYTYSFFTGILVCLDGYMNVAMEQTEEFIDGQLRNKFGDCFIRGNNGKFVPSN